MVPATFTEARSRFIINRLQHQVDIGKRADSGFKAEAWETVTEEFNSEFETKMSRSQLKNHFQGLKTSLGIVRKLRDLSGFGWSDASQTVVAEPAVWNQYLLANPKAKPFRDRPFVLYDDLDTLVGNTAARGHLRRTAKRSHESLTAEEAAQDDCSADEDLPDSLFDQSSSKRLRIDDTPVLESISDLQSTLDHVQAGDGTTSKVDQPSIGSKVDTNVSKSSQAVEPVTPKTEESKPDRGGSRTTSRRVRSNGTQALAESIGAAVKLEEARASAPTAPTVFVKERHADMKKAIALFMAEADEYISDLVLMHAGVKLLRNESDAAFFITMNKVMRWDWLLETIKADFTGPL